MLFSLRLSIAVTKINRIDYFEEIFLISRDNKERWAFQHRAVLCYTDFELTLVVDHSFGPRTDQTYVTV